MRRVQVIGVLIAVVILALWLVRHRRTETATPSPPRPEGLRPGIAPTGPAAQPIPSWFGQRGVVGRRIAGHVTFEGRPVADAAVSIHSLITNAKVAPPAVRTTGADGSFDFGVQPSGTYDVAASAPGKTSAIVHVVLNDPLARPAPDRLELRLVACASSVAGTILDASGTPIPHANVRLDRIVGVKTDAQGAYRLCAPRRKVSIVYDADGYGAVALTIDVRGDVRQDVVLVPEGTLPIRAVRADDGQPVPGAHVSVWPQLRGVDHPAPAYAVTDPEGRALVGGLVPGMYSVTAFSDSLASRGPATAQVNVGANPEIVLRLDATARIRGKVVSSGVPIAGAEVVAVRKVPAASSSPSRSQADGTFVLDRVPLGELYFTAAPYLVVSPASFRIDEAKEYDVVLEVSRLGAITGRVTRGGAPVAGAEVCCVRDVRGGRGDTTTDVDGHYEYRGVAAGMYELQAGTSDAFVNPVKVTLAGNEERTVDLELSLAATITGTIVDQDGKPVKDVYVRWLHDQTRDLSRCDTSADGRYRCGAMTGGGHYTASVFPTAAMQKPFPTADGGPYPKVELKDGTSVVENVRIAIAYQQLTISGHVVDNAGVPVTDARVSALPAQDGRPAVFLPWLPLPVTFTDEDGAFVLRGLVTGNYALQARAVEGGEGIAPSIAAGSTSATITVMRPAVIEGTLAGFSAQPSIYAHRIGESTSVSAQANGTAFRFTGLTPGSYLVNAQTTSEGDAQLVELHPGDKAKITLTSRGRGAIDATVLDFRTRTPIAGAKCQTTLSIGDELATSSWDLASAPTTDATGHVAIDPTPAGSVAVVCMMPVARWSAPSAHLALAPAARATVRLYSVKLIPELPGSIGLQLNPHVTPPRVVSVVPRSSAAKAGIVAGDLVVAVNGSDVEELNGSGAENLIDSYPLGGDVAVTIRRGPERKTITAKVEPRTP